jgi:drug/metabolite transporter (DMT)-like permease
MKRWQTLSGPGCILSSALCFGTYGIWSRMMAGSFNDFFQGWTRAAMILALLIPVGLATRSFRPFWGRELPWVAAYGIPGSLVIPLYFYGFTALPIGVATLAFYAALTVTGYVLGTAVFREAMTRIKLASLVLGLAGLAMVAGATLSASGIALLPILACILAGVCGGTEVTLTKKLSARHSPVQLTATLYAITLIVCLAADLILSGGRLRLPAVPRAWAGDVAHAVASAAAFLLVVPGYARTEAAVGSVIGLMEIPFGILFGLVLFGEPLTAAVIGGTALIGTAAVLPVLAAGKTVRP